MGRPFTVVVRLSKYLFFFFVFTVCKYENLDMSFFYSCVWVRMLLHGSATSNVLILELLLYATDYLCLRQI